MGSNRVEKIIESIDTLPPFPDVARRILEIADSPDIGAKDILEIIQYDQGITANCLKLCNSSYFSLPVKIFTIEQAVALLGLQNIVKIVLANCMALSPYMKAQKGYGLHPGELWRHSVATATLSQLILKKAGRREDSVLFTAALLHDVGKLVLDRYVAENPAELAALIRKAGLTFTQAEKEVLGIDHAELGGIIAENWKFPVTLVNSIRNHHQSMKEKIIPNMESWVRLSNLMYYVTLAHEFCSHHEGISCRINESILFQFGLKQDHVNEILSEFPDEVKLAEELLKIAI
ncbi:MAG: HDOD domain-containing protein [Deltaproteobacteria bacterium]|nr:HDOD domain-containing protein [Deltaproteobacteria bacterium]